MSSILTGGIAVQYFNEDIMLTYEYVEVVVNVLKKRFNNLGASELVRLSTEVVGSINALTQEKQNAAQKGKLQENNL